MKNFLFIFIYDLVLKVICDSDLTINLPQGIVEGTYKKSYFGKTFVGFEGIPYAKPPIGELRFQEPQPPEKWEGTLVANTLYKCLQFSPIPFLKGAQGTEDCLYVNVYIPKMPIDPNDKLDVVVQIHGGIFMIGGPGMLALPDYIMDEELVYVSLNYRVGLLGFLSTEDKVVPGNNGLKDQNFALQWIKQNIGYFGGNPDSITLTGHSAGGASVHYHYLSPLSKGLFTRGWSASSGALQTYALTKNPLQKAKTLAANLTCPTDSTVEMVNCLKKVSGKKLVNAMESMLLFINAVPYALFGPVIDSASENPFIPEHPYKLLKEGKFYDVPWITSMCKDEGQIPLGFFILLGKIPEIAKKWDTLMPYLLDIQDTVDPELKPQVLDKVKEFYLHGDLPSKNNIEDFLKVFNDRIYLTTIDLAMKTHVKNSKSPVYFYAFNYVGQETFHFASTSGGSLKKGVFHGADIRFLFKIQLNPGKFKSADDELMIKKFVSFIKSYATTGKPVFNEVELIPIDPKSDMMNVLNINSPHNVTMGTIKELAPMEFWNLLPIKENSNLY